MPIEDLVMEKKPAEEVNLLADSDEEKHGELKQVGTKTRLNSGICI